MFNTSKVASGCDLWPERGSTASSVTPAFCFSLLSLPEVGVMARVLEQFAKRGLMPTRWFSDVDFETGLLQTDIQVAGLAARLGEDIGRCLGAIVGVNQVLTGTKSSGATRSGC